MPPLHITMLAPLTRYRHRSRARRQLLDNPEVTFGGYRVQHPPEPAIQVKVQTKSENPGPVKAVEDALGLLLKELGSIEKSFRHELDKKAGAEAALGRPGASGHDPMNIG